MRTLTSLLRLAAGFLFVAVASVVTMAVCLVLLPWRILRIKACNVYGHVVGRTIVAIAGVRPKLDHRERLDGSMPAIYVMNHTSTLDAFLGVWMCPIGGCGVFKKETARVPFFGQVAALSGHLLLDRGNKGKAVEALQDTAAMMKQHRLGVWIMPEGHRSETGRLQPFKKGFVHLAIATGYPVVPVIAHGAHKNWELGTFRFVPMDLRVEILEPISTAGWKEETAGEHAALVHDLFQAHLPDDQKALPDALPQAA